MNRTIYLLGGIGFALFFGTLYIARKLQQPGAALIDAATLLDLNEASQQKIEKLEGIDPVLAERIIENRPYRSKMDLIERRIIPDAAYDRIKHQIRAHHAVEDITAA